MYHIFESFDSMPAYWHVIILSSECSRTQASMVTHALFCVFQLFCNHTLLKKSLCVIVDFLVTTWYFLLQAKCLFEAWVCEMSFIFCLVYHIGADIFLV